MSDKLIPERWREHYTHYQYMSSGLALEFCQAVEELAAAEAALSEARNEIDRYQERESSVCPEDVGCDEYIPLLQQQVTQQAATISQLRGIVHLFCTYAPLSGDIALMIRASQPGGDEAHERANNLIAFYEHLNEAHDKGRAALAYLPKEQP